MLAPLFRCGFISLKLKLAESLPPPNFDADRKLKELDKLEHQPDTSDKPRRGGNRR